METLLSIDIVPKLVELLDRRHVAAGSLKIFGNLSSGDNAQIQALVIESGAFAKFGKLIEFKLVRDTFCSEYMGCRDVPHAIFDFVLPLGAVG